MSNSSNRKPTSAQRQRSAENTLDQNGAARDADSGDAPEDRVQPQAGATPTDLARKHVRDNGQLQAGGYREQNPGDAKDQNTGSVKQAQNVGDKSGASARHSDARAGSKQPRDNDTKR